MLGVDAPLQIRIYSDGQTKDSRQSWFSTLVAVTTLTLHIGWLHVLLGLMVASWFRYEALVVLLLLFGTLALPARPLLWPAFCKLYIFKTWREYFKFSYLFEEALDKNKRYVFVEFPHGVYPMGPLLGGTECQAMFPGFHIFSLAASSVFSVPYWRHFCAWIGSLPATSANFKKLLRKGSVAVIVGGIAEMYMQHAHREQVMAKDRKGFVRIALEEGADGIVPVFHFGNSQLLDFWPRSLQKTSRRLRASLGFLYGRFGLPLPRRAPVFMVCGKSIPVGARMAKDDPAFAARVDELHAQVVDALQKLYDDHKVQYGWANRPLVLS